MKSKEELAKQELSQDFEEGFAAYLELLKRET